MIVAESTEVTVQSRPETADDDRAAAVRATIQQLVKDRRCVEARTAELLAETRRERYYLAWGFSSFKDYVEAECNLTLSSAETLVRTFDRLVVGLGVPAADFHELGSSKAEVIARVATPETIEGLLEDARKLSTIDLRDKVRKIKLSPTAEAAPSAAEPARLDEATSCPPDLTPGWRHPRPRETEFYVDPRHWEQLMYAQHAGKNVLLTGPAGCGKSELCALAARAAGRTFESFNCGAMSEPRSTLIGNTHFDRRTGTRFSPSRFVRAVQRPGCCILLDEISRAGRDAFNILLPLLDRQGYLALDESEDAPVIHRASGVSFLATANLGAEYTGTEALDRALEDRFATVIVLDHPPPDKEAGLLLAPCPDLSESAARQLVDMAARQRALAREREFVGTISTRSLIEAGEQIAAGITMDNALEFCVVGRFSREGGEQSEHARLKQLLQEGFRG